MYILIVIEISIKADTYSENSELKRIEILMEVHDSIVDAANEVNSNYSVQILICLAVLLIKTVFALFFAYFEQFVSKIIVYNSVNLQFF